MNSLLEVYDRTKVTIFFITHDLEEAIFLGDRVVIMTTRPAQVKKVVEVGIPRPRDFHNLVFGAISFACEETKGACTKRQLRRLRLASGNSHNVTSTPFERSDLEIRDVCHDELSLNFTCIGHSRCSIEIADNYGFTHGNCFPTHRRG